MGKFLELLNEQAVILGDGAMGTMLFAAGLDMSDSPELWNVEHPERVMAVHRAYAQAGSNLILTNSFGGNRFRLALHGLEGRVYELNRSAAEIARRAVEAITTHTILVGGSVGPSGEQLDPAGTLIYGDAVSGFAEQAAGLRDGGVDFFQVETMSDLREVDSAVAGIRQESDLPIVITMSFDGSHRTLAGTKPEDAARHLVELGAAAVGANCGSDIEDTIFSVAQMRNSATGAVIVFKSSLGTPRYAPDGGLLYDITPSDMAEYARRVRDLGVRIIGACCGSTPEHIKAMVKALL